MSKQVERKGDNLIVRTREDYESASRVIVMRKNETAKVFYPFIPRFIENLDEVKDWTICGYRVEDLYKLALILKGKRIEDYDLRDYNACFFEGYARAREDFNKSLEEMVNKIIGGDNN